MAAIQHEHDCTAQHYAEQFWAEDVACSKLGINLVSVGPGTAKLSLDVSESMINSHNICHGALIFALQILPLQSLATVTRPAPLGKIAILPT